MTEFTCTQHKSEACAECAKDFEKKIERLRHLCARLAEALYYYSEGSYGREAETVLQAAREAGVIE